MKFKLLTMMLKEKTEDDSHTTKMLVQSETYGLCNRTHIVDSLVCQTNSDQRELVVFLDDLPASKFYRSTLINLAQSAEMISPAC